MRKLISLCLLAFIIGCDDNHEKKHFFELKSVDVSNAVGLFATVYGDYHNGEGRFLMETLFKLDENKNYSEVEFDFEGNTGDEKRFSVFDVNDQYFLISFFEIEKTYFVEKTTGKALPTAYIVPSYYFPECYLDDQGNFYARDNNEQIYKISNALSSKASKELLPISATKIYPDKDGKLLYEREYTAYLYSSGTETKLLENIKGMWIGLDGKVRVLDGSKTIYKLSEESLNGEHVMQIPQTIGYLWDIHYFPSENKIVGVSAQVEGENQVFELSSQPALRLSVPDKMSVGFYDFESDRAGKYLYFFYGSREGEKTLQKIDVTDFTNAETVVNTDYGFHSMYAMGDFALLGLCVPDEFSQGGCKDQLAFTDASGNVEFLQDDVQWYPSVIRLK